MRANKLIINNLYGYINKIIDFNPHINLLVGINGSGKTSVLNIIYWLITPTIEHLCITEFKSLILYFNYNDVEYKIETTQDDKEFTYKLENLTENKKYHPLKVSLTTPPSKLTGDEIKREEAFAGYLRLTPDKNEFETWHFVHNELPKPIIVGLDRYLFTKEMHEYRRVNRRRELASQIEGSPKPSPLDEVKNLTNREYSKYNNSIIELNRDLNYKIMLSSFEEITNSSLSELERISTITLEQVNTLHKKVERFFSETFHESLNRSSKPSSNYSLKKIEKYFNNLKRVIEEAKQSEEKQNPLYLANLSQFKKLKELITEFETFDIKSQNYFADLKIYLDTINRFLVDSSKELTFQKEVSELTFNILDKESNPISKNRDIKTLSSGEKQILTLLTYLKFLNKSGTIFIIDEPEISLHPKWQEDFLSAVEDLTEKNTQIIIATHSPIIVGNNKENCIVLLPYNT